MNRDKPPFRPSDHGQAGGGYQRGDGPRRVPPDADTAGGFRFSRRGREDLPSVADQGEGGGETPSRSFSRTGRFSREDQGRDTEPPGRASFPGDARRFATTSGPPERGRAPRMERPSFLDRVDDDDSTPRARRPSFPDAGREDSRSELRPSSSSFLDRGSDNRGEDPRRPSFLEKFRPEDNMPDSDLQPFGAREEIDAPSSRPYRDSLQRDNGGDTGPDAYAYGTQRPARSRERSPTRPYERPDSGFARGSAEGERRFDLGQTTRSRRDDEISPQASKDWRSPRFASRFSQPPKAYDLDEAGDRSAAFEQAEDTGMEPPHEMDRESVPRYSEEDLLKKARARSWSRLSRSSGPAEDSYSGTTPRPDDRPEFEEELARLPHMDERAGLPEAGPFDEEPEVEEPDFAQQRRYRSIPDDPSEEILPPVEEFNQELFEKGARWAGASETEFEEYGTAGDFDQGQRYYDDADATGDPALSAAPDSPPVDDLPEEPPASGDMLAPPEQAGGYEPADGHYPEADGLRRGYDDYDTIDRRGEPDAALPNDDLRAERAPGDEGAYPQYSHTFGDYEETGNRKPLLLVGALAGVAIVAGGLIFAYRMFAPGGGEGVVPVVKLEEAPSKVAPNDPGGLKVPHQNKLIYDRIAGEKTVVAEKVVPREEEVIELDTSAEDPLLVPDPQDGSAPAGETAGAVPPPPVPPAADGGNIPDPGRAEEVAILKPSSDVIPPALPEPPDTPIAPPITELPVQPAVPEPPQTVAPEPPQPAVPEQPQTTAQQPPRPAAPELPQPATPEAPAQLRTETVEAPAPGTRIAPPVPPARPEAPRRASAETDSGASPGSGPIQLDPFRAATDAGSESSVFQGSAAPTTPVQSSNLSEAIAPPPASEPSRLVTVPPAQPEPSRNTESGEYLIQIAAFRTQPEAEKEYAKLRGKHASLLQPYGPLIQRADLGSRGIFYRLRLGPFQTKADASAFCNSLIVAGEKDCLVRRAR